MPEQTLNKYYVTYTNGSPDWGMTGSNVPQGASELSYDEMIKQMKATTSYGNSGTIKRDGAVYANMYDLYNKINPDLLANKEGQASGYVAEYINPLTKERMTNVAQSTIDEIEKTRLGLESGDILNIGTLTHPLYIPKGSPADTNQQVNMASASGGTGSTNIWLNKDGKEIDPSKYTNLRGDELTNWAYSQGFTPKSGSSASQENLRLLGPTEFEGLNKDWREAGLTEDQVNQFFLVRKFNEEKGVDDIYLRTDAPSSESILSEAGRRYIGPTEWEELQAKWKEQGLSPAEIEKNLIERDAQGNIYLKLNQQEISDSTIGAIKDGRAPMETDIEMATPAEDLVLGNLSTPNLTNLPDPVQTFNSEAEGLAQTLASKKSSINEIYDKQIADAEKKMEALKIQIDSLESKKEGIIEGDLKEAYSPYQEELEKAERERLKIEENYFANQASIQQLEDLLNTAMADIKAAEATTGLSSIRIPRINAIKNDWQGRVGVIEAVMAARNNQIAVGNNLIDRMSSAIATDKQLMIDYYTAQYNYYDSLQGKKEAEYLNLDDKKMEALNGKISMEMYEIENLQATKNYVQQLLLDPGTAGLMEQAGVSLTDSVDTINKKLANASYFQEGVSLRNTFEANGYQAVTTASQLSGVPKDRVITQYDSRGKAYQFIIPESAEQIETSFINSPSGELLLVNSQNGDVIKNYGATPKEDLAYGDRDTQIITASGKQMLVDKQTGEVLADFGGAYKASSGGSASGSSTSYKFSSDDRGRLLAVNFTSDEINQIQNDINKYGVGTVIDGLPEDQANSILNIIKGVTPAQESDQNAEDEFLTVDYLKQMFGNSSIDNMLETLGKERDDYAKFWSSKSKEEENIKNDFNNYVENDLTNLIEQYRKAGYTDKEILEMLQ